MKSNSIRRLCGKAPLILSMAAVGAVLIPQSALAQQNHESQVRGYVGGGLGYYRLDDEDFLNENDDLKDNRTAWRAFAGAEFGRVFSLQTDYIDFGKTEDGNARMEADGWTISGIAAIPLTEGFAPYAKVGQLFWDRKREQGLFSVSDDGDDVFFGLGTRFTLTGHLDLRLEYERFTLDDTDLDMASAALQFRF